VSAGVGATPRIVDAFFLFSAAALAYSDTRITHTHMLQRQRHR
jgi:hypothetical protein